MDIYKGRIIKCNVALIDDLESEIFKSEIFKNYGERKYKVISIRSVKEKSETLSVPNAPYYYESYIVYIKLGSTLKKIKEKKIAKKNKKQELEEMVKTMYDFIIPLEEREKIRLAKEDRERVEKNRKAEEFRKENNPTLEELKEKLEESKRRAAKISKNFEYLIN